MRIGPLDRQITLEFKTAGKSSSGEPTETWGSDAMAWANVAPLSGREYYAAMAEQVVADEYLVFTIRFRSDVRPGTARVLYNPGDTQRTYNIRRVVELGRRKFLQLYGETVTA